MNVFLLIVQAVLAVIFLMAGIMKLTQPKEKLADKMAWVTDFSQGQLRMIGIAEILGALGLIVLGLTGFLPLLASLVAIGLALTMVGAILTHLRRKEFGNIILNVILMFAAVLVAIAHFSVEAA
jgi:uncharacterized membrane protein YphA (DoxX/SURF4 family)